MPRKPTNPCSVCTKGVLDSQRGIYCDLCESWVHLKCTVLTRPDYEVLSVKNDDWYCSTCLGATFPFNNIEDDLEFKNIIFNLTKGNSLHSDVLKNNQQLLISNKFNVGNLEIDPDKYFYHGPHKLNDSYFVEDDFNKIINVKSLASNFSLLHINTRSLNKKIAKLTTYLNILNHKFSVIAITETWGTVINEEFLKISGYNSVLEHRNAAQRGGGVGIYVHETIPYTRRDDLKIADNDTFEQVFIELKTGNNRINTLIGCIYRPPSGNLNKFNDKFDQLLQKLSREKKQCLLAGDYNINLLNHKTNIETDQFLNNMYASLYFPLITEPTRFSKNSSTLIDNIFCNIINPLELTGMLVTDISDHLPVFCILQGVTTVNEKVSYVKSCRLVDEIKIAEFSKRLSTLDWSDLNNVNDINLCYNTFLNTFTSVYNECLPLQRKTVRYYRGVHKPWISQGIIKSIKKNTDYIKTP
jgi:hypothetical protein